MINTLGYRRKRDLIFFNSDLFRGNRCFLFEWGEIFHFFNTNRMNQHITKDGKAADHHTHDLDIVSNDNVLVKGYGFFCNNCRGTVEDGKCWAAEPYTLDRLNNTFNTNRLPKHSEVDLFYPNTFRLFLILRQELNILGSNAVTVENGDNQKDK